MEHAWSVLFTFAVKCYFEITFKIIHCHCSFEYVHQCSGERCNVHNKSKQYTKRRVKVWGPILNTSFLSCFGTTVITCNFPDLHRKEWIWVKKCFKFDKDRKPGWQHVNICSVHSFPSVCAAPLWGKDNWVFFPLVSQYAPVCQHDTAAVATSSAKTYYCHTVHIEQTYTFKGFLLASTFPKLFLLKKTKDHKTFSKRLTFSPLPVHEQAAFLLSISVTMHILDKLTLLYFYLFICFLKPKARLNSLVNELNTHTHKSWIPVYTDRQRDD